MLKSNPRCIWLVVTLYYHPQNVRLYYRVCCRKCVPIRVLSHRKSCFGNYRLTTVMVCKASSKQKTFAGGSTTTIFEWVEMLGHVARLSSRPLFTRGVVVEGFGSLWFASPPKGDRMGTRVKLQTL